MAELERLFRFFIYLSVIFSFLKAEKYFFNRKTLHIADSVKNKFYAQEPSVFERDSVNSEYFEFGDDKFHRRIERDLNGKGNITTKMTRLNDSHQQLMVQWIGVDFDVIVCLAKNGKSHTSGGMHIPSSVYISYDYGDTFDNKTEFFTLSDKNDSYANLDQFVFHPKFTDHVIFSDAENKVIFTTRDSGKTILRVKLPFHPSVISFHDDEPFTFLAHDKINSNQKLWLTKDYGQTWLLVQEYVKKFFWSGTSNPTVPNDMLNIIPMKGYHYQNTSELMLFVERIEPSGNSTVLSSPSLFQHSKDIKVWISDIIEFKLVGDFMFVVKVASKNNVDLYVSYKRGAFVKAIFPSELDTQDYHIPDLSEGQIFVAVSHTDTLANLYTSQSMDSSHIYFSLSLERILCFYPNSTWKDSWLMAVTEEAFADFYKVEGLRGIYIASQVQPDADPNNIGPEHLLTLITFDRGGEWRPITPPPIDESGIPIKCNPSDGCSLHLSQKFSQLYPSTRSIPILSSKSAPGIIMATGTIGRSLKGYPAVFLSRDGGLTWRQILNDYYFFNFGDHGGLLVAVKYFRANGKSRELLYSTDEGERFLSYEFHAEELRVYGLMARPGGDTTVFTMFGSSMGHHQWLIIKVDLKNAFSYNCTADDYKFWSPRSKSGPKMPCILGKMETYERRIAHSNCYNGKDYERPIKMEICECDMEDFECDFGFERSITERQCIREKPLEYVPFASSKGARKPRNEDSPYSIPTTCYPGGFYNRTRGYKKIPGDVCENGKERIYLPDTFPCPLSEKKEFLLVAQRQEITRVDLTDASTVVLPITNLTNVIAIEFDMRNNCVYWADIRHKYIGRQCLSNGTSKPEHLVTHNISSIEGMALDWASNNLYFVDGLRSQIEVIRTDTKMKGRMRRTILNDKYLKKPRGIAVHPVEGYLFWTDWAPNEPSVSRSNLDGKDVRRLFTKPLVQWPNGITIDHIAQRIFWVDAKQDYIASSNLDGKQFRKIIEGDERIIHPFAVAVFKDNMYWDDWKRNSIFIADKDHGIGIQPILRNLSGLMDLKIFAHSFQEGTNQCGNSSINKCSHLCMGGPDNTHTCLCPENMVMEGGSCFCPGREEPDQNGACTSIGHTCAPGSFLCANNLCIPENWVCNNEDDCGDNSDEQNCNKVSCSKNMFPCADGQCLPLIWQCDHDYDCPDKSDEENCEYHNVTCKPSEFRCKNGRCIKQYMVCDADDDCQDNSDEEDCRRNSTDVSCHSNEFKCGSTCVPMNWRCDGEVDCEGHEDELNCNLASCEPEQFKCDRKCIFAAWTCDGEMDCDDKTDEANCTSTTAPDNEHAHSVPGWDPCSIWSFRCRDKKCIPYWWKCDGVGDCDDKSDEIGCDNEDHTLITTVEPHDVQNLSCKEHQFRCYSGECIQDSWVCDNMMDCNDGEDEENCNGEVTCTPEQFRCRTDGSCIFLNQVCDGEVQCPDSTDELDCSTDKHIPGPAGPSCSPGFFPCDASRCIPLSQLCDKVENCYDGTDESNLGCLGTKIARVYQILEIVIDQRKSSPTSLQVYWRVPNSQNVQLQFLPSISEVDGSWQKWQNKSWIDGSEYRFTSLKPYTKYNMTIYVRVANTSEVFPAATFLTALTSEGVPSPPRNVSVVQKSYMSVEVSWLPPLTPNGPIVSYDVRVSPPYPPLLKLVSGTSNRITFEAEFSKNRQYKFWVIAKNNKYDSNSSDIATLRFDPLSVIETIQGLQAQTVDKKSIRLSWKPIHNVDGYNIQTSFASELIYPKVPAVNVTKNSSSVIITNLAPKVRYKFEVYAFRNTFVGPPSTVKGFIEGAGLPSVPIIYIGEVFKGEEATVVLRWQPPQNFTQQKWIYGIYYAVRMEELIEGAKMSTTNLSVTIPNLAACETYMFDIGLVGPLGIGPLAAPLPLTTSYNKNAPPKNLFVEVNPSNENEMIVRWESSCKIVTEPIGFELVVLERNLNKSSSVTFVPSTKTQMHHIFKTHYGGKYSVTVSTTAPNAISSAAVHYDAPEILPPHQVQVLTQSNGSCLILWQENKLPKAIKESRFRYKILVSEGGTLNTSIAKQYFTEYPRFTFTEVKEGIIYSFGVMLVTEDGYSSSMSEIGSFQTPVAMADEFFSTTSFVSILVPIMILLTALLIVLGFFIYRQKRLKRHFGNYANSHYDTRSGSTTFGGADDLDEEDSPNIRGFSDDEPLVMA